VHRARFRPNPSLENQEYPRKQYREYPSYLLHPQLIICPRRQFVPLVHQEVIRQHTLRRPDPAHDPTKARWKGVSPILVQMWQGASPVPVQMWHSGASPVPVRVCARRDGRRRIGRVSAWPCRCCDGSISAPFPLRPYSHLVRVSAWPCCCCDGSTSAPYPLRPYSHLVRASAWPCRCCDGSTYYSAPRSAHAKVWSESKRSCVAVLGQSDAAQDQPHGQTRLGWYRPVPAGAGGR
jgi:hypothetical protein